MLALLLIFALVTFSHFATMLFSGDAVQTAEDINLSGRQRMLSQRIMFIASQYRSTDFTDSISADALGAAVKAFSEAHEKLVSEEIRTLPENVRAIYFEDGPHGMLDQSSRQFIAAGEQMLNSSDLGKADSAYFYMASVGPYSLLQDLNAAVSAFESDARADTKRGALVGYFGYFLAVLALVVEAFLIFRPAHRTIVQAMDDLEDNNEKLKQQEAEAFAALEDAEDAWMEAEQLRAQSDRRVVESSDKYKALMKSISPLFRNFQHLTTEVGRGPLSTAQQQAVQQAARLLAVLKSSFDTFAVEIDPNTDVVEPRSLIFNLPDLLQSAALISHHIKPAQSLKIEIPKDIPTTQVTGDPIMTLRLLIAAFSHLILDEDCVHLKVRLAQQEKSDTFDIALSIYGFADGQDGENPKLKLSNNNTTETFMERLIIPLNQLSATADLAHNQDGAPKIDLNWSVQRAVVRLADQKRRIRKSR